MGIFRSKTPKQPSIRIVKQSRTVNSFLNNIQFKRPIHAIIEELLTKR
jgi:hypothetical protein